jgi:hypothetical protein
LHSENGYNMGSAVRKSDSGTWRVPPHAESVLRQPASMMPLATHSMASYAIRAMRLEHGPAAIDLMRGLLQWDTAPSAMAVQMAEVAALVPRHALSAALSGGVRILGAIGMPYGDAANARNWTSAMKQAGVDLDAPVGRGILEGREGWPPLVLLAKAGDYTFVQALIAEGAYLEARGKDGMTPFLAACASGHRNVVDLLHELGADVQARDSLSCNGMHLALNASKTMADAIDVLETLKGFVDPTQEDFHGQTPLDMLNDMEVGEGYGREDIEERVREILSAGPPAPVRKR